MTRAEAEQTAARHSREHPGAGGGAEAVVRGDAAGWAAALVRRGL